MRAWIFVNLCNLQLAWSLVTAQNVSTFEDAPKCTPPAGSDAKAISTTINECGKDGTILIPAGSVYTVTSTNVPQKGRAQKTRSAKRCHIRAAW